MEYEIQQSFTSGVGSPGNIIPYASVFVVTAQCNPTRRIFELSFYHVGAIAANVSITRFVS